MAAFIKGRTGALTVYLNNGEVYTVPPNFVNFKQVKKHLLSGDERKLEAALAPLCKRVEVTMTARTGKKVEIVGNAVHFDGTPMHNSVTSRIIDHAKNGLPVEGLLKFLENLMENPSNRSVNELYSFLENHGLPITTDGCFLAYKAVRDNFLDIHTGTIDNTPGLVVKMPRNEVDDNANKGCSHGLHVGDMTYVRGYGAHLSRKIVLVKVNPKDCVSVPHEDARKIRVCEYKVIKEIDWETALEETLYDGEGVSPVEKGTYLWGAEQDDCDLCDDEDYCDLDDDAKEELRNAFNEELRRHLQMTRDQVVEVAFNEGLIRTKKEGRRMGKDRVCNLIAEECKRKRALYLYDIV